MLIAKKIIEKGSFEPEYFVIEINGLRFRLSDRQYSRLCYELRPEYDVPHNDKSISGFFDKIVNQFNRQGKELHLG